ncbi:MAG: 4-hydroxy-tetrahydrodipicolinate reductase [Rhabdochlamydiaceae bacterium]
MVLKIIVIGSTGRLGTHIVNMAQKNIDFLMATLEEADVIIDASSPSACENNISKALTLHKPLIIGTTGHTQENLALIQQATQSIPLLFAPNFSLGMTVCLEAVSLFAEQLKGLCTIEITETHHMHKKDTPSGTALALSQAIDKKNPPPIHSIREGEIMGDHTVTFSCEGEKIEVKHQIHSREAFAIGALKAAQFIIHQNPGLYTMKDVSHVAC